MSFKRKFYLENLKASAGTLVTLWSSFLLTATALATDFDDPSLEDARPVFVNIMNWAVFVVGIVFVLYVAYGVWKGSTALGDPRGLEAAKSTWVYAIYGLLIVVAFFGIYSIIAGFLGFSIGFDSIFDGIFTGITELTGLGGFNPNQ